jgi:hypothetical protein|tara:strand:- start:4184 stop:4939 length:756 start_codon:yes stop_codon:yes gene_type:complete
MPWNFNPVPNTGDVSDRFNSHINEALENEERKQPVRGYIGGSNIGTPCTRKLQYHLEATPRDKQKPLTGDTLRIFQAGHTYEDMLILWLKKGGFGIKTRDRRGQQFAFEAANGNIKGHVDGIIMHGQVDMGYPALWECKSANDRNFKAFKSKGVAQHNVTYSSQIAVYQYYMNLTENPAVFSVVNKNTQELYHELVPFDSELAQRCIDKAVLVIKAVEAKERLPRIAQEPDHYLCKFCDFQNHCWETEHDR